MYTTLIAHRKPLKCPLGALAFYFHYIHDVVDLTSKLNIDWTVNKTWWQVNNVFHCYSDWPRQVRLLHSSKSPTVPFSDHSLLNLFTKAFSRANFESHMKVHLARHLLGYQQEWLGWVFLSFSICFAYHKLFSVDPHQTSKLGWVRHQTYFDTYAPALPKEVCFVLPNEQVILNLLLGYSRGIRT